MRKLPHAATLVVVVGLTGCMLEHAGIGEKTPPPLAGSLEHCTVFTASVGDTVLFGNNEDWDDKDTYVWVFPGTATGHGAVCFGFSDHFAQGGINDQGLCFDATMIPGLPMKSHPDRLLVVSFGERVLEQCATVGDVAQFVEEHDFCLFGRAQFLFADKTGDSVIVCPGEDGEMKVIRKEGMYQAITNFNVTFPQLGGYPCWRYSACVRMLKEIEDEDDLTVEYFVSILKAVYQRSTTYSTIYDLKNGVVYLYNQHHFEDVVVLKVEDEVEKGQHTLYIPSLFPRKVEGTENEPVPEKSQSPRPLTTAPPELEPEPLNAAWILVVAVAAVAAVAVIARCRSR